MALIVTVPFDCDGTILAPGTALDAAQSAWLDQYPELRSRVVSATLPTIVNVPASSSTTAFSITPSDDDE